MNRVLGFGVRDDDDPVAQKADGGEAPLAVLESVIRAGERMACEYTFRLGEIQTMFLQVGLPLVFVPSEAHAMQDRDDYLHRQYTDAENQTILMTWGPGHQLQTRTLQRADGSVERVETHTRNPLGQTTRLEVKDGTGVLTLAQDTTYDPAHRPIAQTETRAGQSPHTLTHAFSPGGLLNSVTDSANNRWDYLYDPTGRLAAIWAPNFDYLAFTWDAGGRLLERWSSRGTRSVYAWNDDDSLATLDHLLPNGAA